MAIVTQDNNAAVLVPFGPTEQDLFVSKAGSDVTGTGTYQNPFLTIQRAINLVITNADNTAAKPYVVHVGAGTFSEIFALIPWVTISGVSRLATTLAPVQANWISASFAVAGTLEATIENCTIATILTIDYAAIAAIGAPRILLRSLAITVLGLGLTAIGNNANCTIFLDDIQRTQGTFTTLPTGTITLSNINSSVQNVNGISTLAINGNDLYATHHLIGPNRFSILTVVSTATVVANRLTIQCCPETTLSSTNVNITGIFASVIGPMRCNRSGLDVNTEFGFGSSVVAASVGSTMLVDGGDNTIISSVSVIRVYSIGRPITSGTRLRIKNQGVIPIDFVFLGGPGVEGGSYAGAGAYVEMFFSGGTWNIDSPVQSGTTQLVLGVSPFIPADIDTLVAGVGPGNIQATLATFSGAHGSIVAKQADRIVGTRAGGGGFILTSIDPATGVTIATDTGIYDWMAVRP